VKPAEAAHALVIDGLSKRFGATLALDDASVTIGRGEIHALLGENGAGKSTLVRILSGLTRPDAGTISVFGERARADGPRGARALGIATAFQEVTLVPDLTVQDNLLLDVAPVRLGFVLDRRRARRWTEAALARLELVSVDPQREIRDCPLPLRQKLEIARAIAREPRILLLDEPTSALSVQDVEWLERRIAELRARGATVLFITHRMPEVRRFCDRLSILRNGRQVGTFAVGEISHDEVVRLVIGRSPAATFPAAAPPQERGGAPALEVRKLTVRGRVEDVTFSLWPGEILGVAGLQGMGQNELFHALFGVAPADSGSIAVDGRAVVIASPRDAIDARIGISLVPEERRTEALSLKLSGLENVSLPTLNRFARFGWLDLEAERRAVDRVLARVQVHPRALYRPCASFSGGNQQKIAIAKWLLAESRVLLLFDPTRGVDVGAKHEIYVLVRQFADAGGAVLFYSTDVLEIVNLCRRVITLYDRRINAELAGEAVREEEIMRFALGQGSASAPVERAL